MVTQRKSAEVLARTHTHSHTPVLTVLTIIRFSFNNDSVDN